MTQNETSQKETFPPPKADRAPTADETKAAERAADDVDLDSVAEHEQEMNERGANVKGEGAISPPR